MTKDITDNIKITRERNFIIIDPIKERNSETSRIKPALALGALQIKAQNIGCLPPRRKHRD